MRAGGERRERLAIYVLIFTQRYSSGELTQIEHGTAHMGAVLVHSSWINGIVPFVDIPFEGVIATQGPPGDAYKMTPWSGSGCRRPLHDSHRYSEVCLIRHVIDASQVVEV